MRSFRFPAAGLTALILVASSSSGADPAAVDEKRMEAWWADLEKGETAATRALLKFSDRPKSAVDFLKTKMKPLTISSGQVKALLLKLGNANEAVWKPAFEELEYFDPRLAIDLQTLMDRYKESPARQRMVEVLSGHEAGSLKGKDVQLRKLRNGGPDDFNFTQLTEARGGPRTASSASPPSMGATSRRSGPAPSARFCSWNISAPPMPWPSSKIWPPAIPTPIPPRWPRKP